MRQSTFADFVTGNPWPIIVAFLATTAFFALQLPDATIDTEMKGQLPADLRTRASLDEIESLFGGTDRAMIILSSDDVLQGESLKQLRVLSRGFSSIPEFDRVTSLFNAHSVRSEAGGIVAGYAVERVPENAAGREKLRNTLQNNTLVYGNIVSKDFKHTALTGFLRLGAPDEVAVDKLNQLADSVPGPGNAVVGGMPLTRVNLARDVRDDMRRFLPVGLLAMLVLLFVCFRQARGVTLPFLVTVMAIIVAMGLAPLLGWKIHTVTVLLPVILLAVANDYGIHVLARYQEDNGRDWILTPKQLAGSGVAALARPILATGVTTMAGLLSLLSHSIVPAGQLGALAATGIAFAVVGSLCFIPAVLSLLPRSKPVLDHDLPSSAANPALDRLLFRIASWVPNRPGSILVTCSVVALVVGSGARLIVVDTNPMNFYAEDEPVWQSTHILNAHLGGWAGVSAVASGDIRDPAVLLEIDKLEQHLRKHELVGTTTSIAGLVRRMNQATHGGDPAYDRIPASEDMVTRHLQLLAEHGDPAELKKLVDPRYENAQLMARVKDSSTRGATTVTAYIRSYLDERPESPFRLVGGMLDVMAELVVQVVRGQMTSMFVSVLIVGSLVGLLMRSLSASLLAAFPLALALLLLFGIMGLVGIELNLITAMLSSIMIGIGVDYTIHFLWRYREERTRGAAPEEAVRKTLTTAGRGIVFNALSVLVGFAVLALSAFFPVRFFGLLIVISISACLVGALLVLPAIVLVFRPKFLDTPR